MPTRFTLEEGDMIVFKATKEVCVLVKRFDAVQRRQNERGKGEDYSSWPSWCWDTQWTTDYESRGPWQERLTVAPKHQRFYGVSDCNLFNALSHARAIKKGKVITVKTNA